MLENCNHLSRRVILKSALIAAAGYPLARTGAAQSEPKPIVPLFDGSTLNGWIQSQNSSTSFGSGDMIDLTALAKMLTDKSSSVAAFLASQLDDAVKTDLGSYSPANQDAAKTASSLAKNLNKIIFAGPIYDKDRFQNVALRPGTLALLGKDPHGRQLVQLNRQLLEDAFPSELAKSSPSGWIIAGGAMASTGTGRGVIYTGDDYSRYRLMFTMRHVSGDPDHQACVLIFCTRPQPDEMPLDALGGIQFQVPNGGHWDYRPGKNTAGGDVFTVVLKPKFDPHQWSRVELLVDAALGEARMAVAQPVGSKAVEVLDFKDPAAGKRGPIAWQMHNGGLFDEYKDVVIETDPQTNQLITVS
jgi:hypothetical protein